MFQHAIVRKPAQSIVRGLSTANMGLPDYDIACEQHSAYVRALQQCGLEVSVLPADERYPDSTFVEDTALLTPHCAIMANPGAPSRQGEVDLILPIIKSRFDRIEFIKPPGTLEPGDVLSVGSHFYIGLSRRTNLQGANELIAILAKYGMSASTVKLKDMLHLKTGVAFLKDNTIIASGELISHPEFQKYTILSVDTDEAYAANCLWLNGTVLIAKGFPKTAQKIRKSGYQTIELDMSEFQKVDGGLSCLSLRW